MVRRVKKTTFNQDNIIKGHYVASLVMLPVLDILPFKY